VSPNRSAAKQETRLLLAGGWVYQNVHEQLGAVGSLAFDWVVGLKVK
jgi:hypothetical protein